MKRPTEMTDKQICHWLKKTNNSMGRLVLNGGATCSPRGYELTDRYVDLQEEAKERSIWVSYCIERGLAPEHDAFDCYA